MWFNNICYTVCIGRLLCPGPDYYGAGTVPEVRQDI
jgi:hypothetical protein